MIRGITAVQIKAIIKGNNKTKCLLIIDFNTLIYTKFIILLRMIMINRIMMQIF